MPNGRKKYVKVSMYGRIFGHFDNTSQGLLLFYLSLNACMNACNFNSSS